MKFATAEHPYYPNDWLSKGQTGQLLHRAGLPTRINKTSCKHMSLEVSGTGHISRRSVESFIERRKAEPDIEVL